MVFQTHFSYTVEKSLIIIAERAVSVVCKLGSPFIIFLLDFLFFTNYKIVVQDYKVRSVCKTSILLKLSIYSLGYHWANCDDQFTIENSGKKGAKIALMEQLAGKCMMRNQRLYHLRYKYTILVRCNISTIF